MAGADEGGKDVLMAVRLPARVDAAPEVLWRRPLAAPARGDTILSHDGTLYLLDSRGRLLTFSRRDGQPQGKVETGLAADPTASLTLTLGRLHGGATLESLSAWPACEDMLRPRPRLLAAGLAGRSVAFDAAPVPGAPWSFAHAGTAAFSACGDMLLARVGKRLIAISGPPAVTPAPPRIVEIGASAAVKDVPPGLPVWNLAPDEMPLEWLVAAPLTGADLQTDPFAGRGGRSALPKPGDAVALGGTSAVFVASSTNQLFKNGGLQTLDITAIHKKAWHSTGIYAVAVKNDSPRTLRLAKTAPGAPIPPHQSKTRVFLGGVELAESDIVRLQPGVYGLLIQSVMGKCDDWGKIFLRPRFPACDSEAARAGERHAALAAAAEDAARAQTLE
jgi:hypothetical protein